MRSSNETGLNRMLQALDHRQLAQSLIISGQPDAQTYALEQLARRILCEGPGGSHCPCRSCQIPMTDHPDFDAMVADGQHIRLDEARRVVGQLVARPLWSSAKVVAISPADSLRHEAENYLLKHLEEPPPYVYYLLLTEAPERLLPTIRSRCQWWRLEDDGNPRHPDGEPVIFSQPLTVEGIRQAAYWVRDEYGRTGRSEWLTTWDTLQQIYGHLEANGNAEVALAQLRQVWPRR